MNPGKFISEADDLSENSTKEMSSSSSSSSSGSTGFNPSSCQHDVRLLDSYPVGQRGKHIKLTPQNFREPFPPSVFPLKTKACHLCSEWMGVWCDRPRSTD